ncbi:Hypothetical predicted protein [Paramuricea clavata]|uniref:Uncharacterized protein n=1 Tax=Paramuricea clavata TaxID=317549 RepID=A0A7D9ILP7_PARCT|nr:Hypothetical predicted protein [Paramuricea clavata]
MERYSVTGLVNNGRRLLGAFHLTEILEILLENQMEHVNFWNAVSLILKNVTLSLKSLLAAFGEINPDSRHGNGREPAVLVAVFAHGRLEGSNVFGKCFNGVKISKFPEFPICGQPREIVRNFRNIVPEINVFHLIFKQDFRNLRQMESAHAA